MEKTGENFWLVVGQGLYMLVQKERVLAPSLEGMCIYWSYMSFSSSTSGGWSGS